MATTRKLHPSLTPQRARELSELAQTIDREEGPELKRTARTMFRRSEKMRNLILALRSARIKKNLSFAQVGEESEIGKANLCRLETHPNPNPTLDTILRYADAMGLEVEITLREKRSS